MLAVIFELLLEIGFLSFNEKIDQPLINVLLGQCLVEREDRLPLLKKRKQMREVDDALEFMNEEYKARVAECERGQLEFERKQVDMKKMVAQFQQFITENDAKQRRAEIKAKVRDARRHSFCPGRVADRCVRGFGGYARRRQSSGRSSKSKSSSYKNKSWS